MPPRRCFDKISRMKNVTVGLQIQRRDTLDGLLPVLARLGVTRMLLYSNLAHPTLGQRRLAEIGVKLRDAGIEVETYFTGHVLGENSPDSLVRKIEAAKAVGARALCLNMPEDQDIERSREKDQRYNAEYRHLEEFVLSDWDKAKSELRAAGLGIRLRWVTGAHRRSDNILRTLLAKGRGKDVGLSWYTYGDASFVKYELPPQLRVFGKRIQDFSMAFDHLGSWISHGYSFYGGYDHYTLDQKKDKYIEEFFDCWPPALDLCRPESLDASNFVSATRRARTRDSSFVSWTRWKGHSRNPTRESAQTPKTAKGGTENEGDDRLRSRWYA